MYPSFGDFLECRQSLKAVLGNCVTKARYIRGYLLECEWPENKINYCNCRTENKEYHRVVVVNHEGWQYVIDGRLPVMLLDDCPYTDWYGGIGLT